LHTDHLATPRLATDQNQTIVWKWESDAYGATPPVGSITINLRFAGQYFDAESGWFYNWNRYYLPKEGRYLTSDPIGLKGGSNTYTYVRNNPINLVDPIGLTDYGNTAGQIGGYLDYISPGSASFKQAYYNCQAGNDWYAAQWALQGALEFGTAGLTAGLGQYLTIIGRCCPTIEAVGASVKGGIGPVIKGTSGVEKSIAAAEARGETILGREITMDTTGGRTRPDLLVRRL
jgi:RHS repeat-associated protein